ncbi:MAG: NAD(P)/FAD-dependent oxidoreductase [Leptolyngbya sp. SIOISBB]|nr:NAD(P)/FAD-dependent oxidoreductase [Leptolyngbya sp. SIOISBB]
MAVEYDLVIVGGTPEGYSAAAEAIRYGARVALILQDLEGERSLLIHRGLLQSKASSAFAMPPAESSVTPWQWSQQRATLIADTLTQDTAQQLMVQGVDVIAERGQIMGDRPLTLATATRQLTTRAVLVATGNQFKPPHLPGLGTVPYDTPITFWQRAQLPPSVVIVGSSPEGIVLAQWLAHQQVSVSLITSNERLLNQEDPAVSGWLVAQLRADGVDLRLGAATVTVSYQNLESAEPAIAVKLPNDVITAAALVLAPRPIPNTNDLGLEKCLSGDLPMTVNAFLQTEHPQIYLCGAAIGGYELPAIARQEARWAVQNALFWPRHRANYDTIPYDLPTQPPMARVGFTEPQARQRFSSDDILVVRQSLYRNPRAQWQESTVGFCKLIGHRDGRLLGCHGVGPEASEWVQMLAALMTQKTPWWRLANLPTLPYSLTELLRQAAQQWESDRWQPGQWRRDWVENWCNWRRSR